MNKYGNKKNYKKRRAEACGPETSTKTCTASGPCETGAFSGCSTRKDNK